MVAWLVWKLCSSAWTQVFPVACSGSSIQNGLKASNEAQHFQGTSVEEATLHGEVTTPCSQEVDHVESDPEVQPTIATVNHAGKETGYVAATAPVAEKSAEDNGESVAKPGAAASLEAMTLENLKDLATEVGIKEDGVGWPKCCPPDGNKPDVIIAFLSPNKLDKLTKINLETLATKLGIKEDGVGWPKCCPPDGNKPDIIKTILKPAQ